MMLMVCTLLPAQKKNTQQRRAVTTRTTQQKKKATVRTQPKKTTTKKTQKSNAQQPQTVSGLKAQKDKVEKARAANMKKKAELERNVKQGIENLMIIDTEIAHKRKIIDTIRHDISNLNVSISQMDLQLEALEAELEDRKQRFMKSMRYMHRNRSAQKQLMFIFSADDLNQMYRRMRFTREYATFQKAQGEAVKQKQEQVEKKKQELEESQHKKSQLLSRGEQERKQLEGKQTEQQAQVNSLKKQQKTVQALIEQQQREEAELNARIDQLIAEQIARERARAEEEARKRAAAEAARKRSEEMADKKTEKSSDRKKTTTVEKTRERNVATTGKKKVEEAYTVPDEDRKLSGNFEANRGRLPMPISGAYRIVRGFGPYSPEGLSHVHLVSNGIHLKGQSGAHARCVFDGEVSGVYFQGGSHIVTVRHGRYISVYIGLSSVSVHKGQKVSTNQTLGSLGNDLTMQFQLRHWSELLNPQSWLGR